MYHVVAIFDVPAERHEDFVAAALADGRDSLANETGTQRFELIRVHAAEDEATANHFCLNEAYEDEAAFIDHMNGPYYKRFADFIGDFAAELTDDLPIKGTRIEDMDRTHVS